MRRALAVSLYVVGGLLAALRAQALLYLFAGRGDRNEDLLPALFMLVLGLPLLLLGRRLGYRPKHE